MAETIASVPLFITAIYKEIYSNKKECPAKTYSSRL